ncbi:hypothetical protein [Paenibacillus sp. LHD-38]|uniref:hypothetical protein n=1 Tax=Paenibacillus sp. LHD-38 TaxID=3072143 RepID=UPI00281086B9|nr:hypothetical protein [Paenibacillus sp. LHD-38]MDQ8736117.1 hypothetical protein [Paenibacillus sp. LHD-38]
MENATGLIIRKLTATFVVTAVASIMLAAYHVLGDRGSGVQYHFGTQLMEWSFIYAMYIGAIVLIYGNAVSIGITWARNKWFERQAWLAVGEVR